MLLRPLLATLFLGSAIGVGVKLLCREEPRAKAPPVREPFDREIAPSMIGEMPDDLTLRELYERVSFVS